MTSKSPARYRVELELTDRDGRFRVVQLPELHASLAAARRAVRDLHRAGRYGPPRRRAAIEATEIHEIRTRPLLQLPATTDAAALLGGQTASMDLTLAREEFASHPDDNLQPPGALPTFYRTRARLGNGRTAATPLQREPQEALQTALAVRAANPAAGDVAVEQVDISVIERRVCPQATRAGSAAERTTYHVEATVDEGSTGRDDRLVVGYVPAAYATLGAALAEVDRLHAASTVTYRGRPSRLVRTEVRSITRSPILTVDDKLARDLRQEPDEYAARNAFAESGAGSRLDFNPGWGGHPWDAFQVRVNRPGTSEPYYTVEVDGVKEAFRLAAQQRQESTIDFVDAATRITPGAIDGHPVVERVAYRYVGSTQQNRAVQLAARRALSGRRQVAAAELT